MVVVGLPRQLFQNRFRDPCVPGDVSRSPGAHDVDRFERLWVEAKVEAVEGSLDRFAAGGLHGAMVAPCWLMSIRQARCSTAAARGHHGIFPKGPRQAAQLRHRSGSNNVFQTEVALGQAVLFEPFRDQRPLRDIAAQDDLDGITVDHFSEDLAKPQEQLAAASSSEGVRSSTMNSAPLFEGFDLLVGKAAIGVEQNLLQVARRPDSHVDFPLPARDVDAAGGGDGCARLLLTIQATQECPSRHQHDV